MFAVKLTKDRKDLSSTRAPAEISLSPDNFRSLSIHNQKVHRRALKQASIIFLNTFRTSIPIADRHWPVFGSKMKALTGSVMGTHLLGA